MNTYTSRNDRILLYSGGIDSFCAYHFLGKPQTVYFYLHSKYSMKEWRYIQKEIPSTILDSSLDIRTREQGEKAYVPFRNLLLAIQASHYADIIYIAGLKDDQVRDKNEQAFAMMSSVLSTLEDRKIEVLSPFWDMTKADVVRWYLQNCPEGTKQERAQKLVDTVSCYAPDEQSYCGACPCCFRKWVALRTNDVPLDFYNEALMDEYYQAAKQEKYIPERNRMIMEVVDGYYG